MISYKLDYNKYIVIVPFMKNFIELDEFDDVLDIFKEYFKRVISKYNIKGSVLVNLYLDVNYGIIMEIDNYDIYNSDEIDAKIIFKFDCQFLVMVDYFEYIGSGRKLYYYKNNFYTNIFSNMFIDSEIIYNSDEIIDNGLMLYA